MNILQSWLDAKARGLRQPEHAAELGMKYSTYIGRLQKARNESKEDNTQEETMTETTETKVSGDGMTIVCSTERIKSIEELVDYFKVDLDKWAVDTFQVKTSEGYRKDRRVQWEVDNGVVTHGQVDDSGKIVIVTMYHCKAQFKRKTLADINELDVVKVFESLERKGKAVSKPRAYKAGGETLEVCLADVHIDRTSYTEETDTVEQRMAHVIEDVVARAQGRKFEKIYLVPLGDYYDIDTQKQTTTKGTQQFVQSNPYRMYESGARAIVWAVDRLAEIAPVEYVFIPGNHDYLVSFTLAKLVEAWYRNDKNVTVDTGHDRHKWRQLGINLVGWTHGDMAKANVFGWLQQKARPSWGKTSVAEVHAGHYHTLRVEEKGGTVVRWLPSFSSKTDWEDERGYYGRKASYSFVWHPQAGLVEEWSTNILDSL